MVGKFPPVIFLYGAFLISWLAMLGSLFFSEIWHYPPCVLCWYQRICMYPLVVILAVGIWRKNKEIHLYTLPLALIGLLIGVYHNLLYYRLIPEAIAPCVAGISCTTKFIEWFGFITIPLLSLLGFVALTFCLLVYWWVVAKKKTVK